MQFARADGDTIQLGGGLYRIAGPVNESIINIHSRKVNQGDPGPDDHPINSTWIQSTWTGGGQVRYGRPDTVTGRFYFSTCDTMQAKTISLPPLPDEWSDPGASGNDAVGLGTYDDKVWVAWGTDIRFYNSAGDTWDDIGTNLTSSPANQKGTVFTPSTGALAGTKLFCIPLTTSFDYLNGTAITNVAKSAVDLVAWDNRLWRLGEQGEIECTTDMTTWSNLCYVPDGSTPRHLDIYLTTHGEPTVYVTTSSSVFVWDESSGSLLQSQLQYPKHPDQGRGSCVWRGELWTSVGDGVHRYNRNTIAASGLDRDEGLPRDYAGVILDLEPSYNAIYALMSGLEVYGNPTTDATILHAGDDYMTYDNTSVGTLLMRWDGFGWHYVDSNSGLSPTTVFVSDAGGDYGVWYCTNQKVRRITLTRTYLNLKDDTTNPVRESGYFESSWYNFGWDGQDKVLKTLELFVETPAETEYIDVFYKLDNDTNPYVQLGTITTTGETAFYFGLQDGETPGSTNPNSYLGVSCDRVKLKFDLYRTNATDLWAKPVIRWFSLVARKVLRPVRTFQMVLDLSTNKDYKPDEQRENLINIIRTPSAVDFSWQNETLKVDLVALEFKTTPNPSGIIYVAKVNLVESFETIL